MEVANRFVERNAAFDEAGETGDVDVTWSDGDWMEGESEGPP